MERTRLIVALVALAALGGCLAAPGPGDGATPTDSMDPSDTPATATPTDTPTDEPATGTPDSTPATDTPTAAPPSGSPTPTATPADGNTVDYSELSPASQAAFDDALDGEISFVPDSPYVEGTHTVEAAGPFRDHAFVRKDGQRYRIDIAMDGRLYASYAIYADRASPGENATVTAHANLSAEVRDEVRWAVENGSYGVPMGKWDSLPTELGDTTYVRYDGETYRMSYAVGDYWAETMTVEPVEASG
ncbi:hypothetical protein [Halosimplex pelagicum]|uniref:DUF7979 domain-containing protein n=1 Tax=Halosimplex pelagicum TaxID=869886 RepID=A0A7D5TUC8_9EURY|nr:hypothetical protein [Halosimplex pelagicum]QLH83112.1 hypothetical protein HZS54_16420 [Halosimplex pelagicum]